MISGRVQVPRSAGSIGTTSMRFWLCALANDCDRKNLYDACHEHDAVIESLGRQCVAYLEEPVARLSRGALCVLVELRPLRSTCSPIPFRDVRADRPHCIEQLIEVPARPVVLANPPGVLHLGKVAEIE